MSWKFLPTRPLLWILLVAAIGSGVFSWSRRRTGVDRGGPPEWPPLPDPTQPDERSGAASSTQPDAAGDEQPDADSEAGDEQPDSPVVAERSAWVGADDAGACPTSHPIKAKDSSSIFHVPGGRFYDRTNADRCYVSGEAAESDGYRQSKN